ncbi:hypothetical protein SAMN05518871_105186 [Psychrobacillus sp. OK028]|uniref:hypothetical protein n=1 Tax=Psychrobacillus sp. OK028 TaxID=1884359 RepID=UPI000882BF58|nr:hypothetical protein [Psychrobacillus sp. OK028]SDN45749.1 hypothetical protein SAMN05518871_105186 [Psychrobacillus sp. OK028]
MNSRKIFKLGIVFVLTASFLFPLKSLADWAYAFVVWDDYVYVITTEQVNEVVKKVGHVTKYSDREGTYSGNFSNAYPKGTKYYSIQGISTDEAIAILKDDGTFIKATRDGEYAGDKYGIDNLSSPFFIGLFLIALFIAFISINFSRKGGRDEKINRSIYDTVHRFVSGMFGRK